MIFTTHVDLRITPAAAWNQLSDTDRDAARRSFFADVHGLATEMRSADTADPDALLRQALADAPGDWTPGDASTASVRYEYDERLQAWVCIYDLALLKSGQPFVVRKQIGGVALEANYTVSYTHQSDPLG